MTEQAKPHTPANDEYFFLEPPIQPGELELALHQLRLNHLQREWAHLSPEQLVCHFRWGSFS